MEGHILIVEDDLAIATLESRRIKLLGYSSEIAQNVGIARAYLRNSRFDAMIIDYNIGSGISGVDFYASLKAQGIQIPAVLVTGLEDPAVLLKAIRAGVRDFVPKHENFLDDLGPALERAVGQALAERNATIAEALNEKNEILESVISATEMCYVRTFIGSEQLQNWDGNVDLVFGDSSVKGISTRSELFQNIILEDLEEFKSKLNEAEEKCQSFICQTRFRFDPKRWIYVQGSCFPCKDTSPQPLILVFFDITKRKSMEIDLIQSNLRMTAMNKRLQIGVSEAHHRVKNSLQNITSLLNLQMRKAGSLNIEEAQKLSSHIQGLAKMHDLLTEQGVDDTESSRVDFKPILNEIVETIQSSLPSRKVHSNIESIQLPSRIACTISVVVNELISNAIKHGDGNIDLNFINHDGEVKLSVGNQGSNYPENLSSKISGRNGLSIVEALCKGDLGILPKYKNISSNECEAEITFSVPK